MSITYQSYTPMEVVTRPTVIALTLVVAVVFYFAWRTTRKRLADFDIEITSISHQPAPVLRAGAISSVTSQYRMHRIVSASIVAAGFVPVQRQVPAPGSATAPAPRKTRSAPNIAVLRPRPDQPEQPVSERAVVARGEGDWVHNSALPIADGSAP